MTGQINAASWNTLKDINTQTDDVIENENLLRVERRFKVQSFFRFLPHVTGKF